jgi:CO/xanthine dehydrogenase FAD-binding subunit
LERDSVKPVSFDYVAASALPEALSLLADERDATVLAGGQSLVPMLNLRLAAPRLLVDINGISGLDEITVDGGAVRIGALARQRAVESSAELGRACPLLTEAARLIAHPAIRSRGTVGGSLAHADPRAELPVALLALDARLHCRTASAKRSIGAADFLRGPFMTALEPGELLCTVEIPAVPDGARMAFVERAATHGAFAQAGAAVVLAGRVHAAIALLGAGPGPIRAHAAERAWLEGAAPREVAMLAGAVASEPHRAALLTALTTRALEVAR